MKASPPTDESGSSQPAEETLDLLVIGGGVVGAGVARDAAMRGMLVRLVEQNDFASGTSSRSSRLLHGGLRYLGQGEIGLVREASREKQIVQRIAPHLCQPLPFLFPSYHGSQWPRWKLILGVKTYDLLCGGRNFGPSVALARDEILHELPILKLDGLRGGVRYFDALTNDARLVVDTLRSAANHGAVVNNYTEFRTAERRNNLWHATLIDQQSGSAVQAHAKVIVNAAGPWSDRIPHSKTHLRLTKGVHLVVQRDRLPVPEAVVMAEGDRILFAIPWGDCVILGTTDTDFSGDPSSPQCTTDDMQYVLDVVNRSFPSAALTPADVGSTWAGLRPLVADADGNPSDISRRHEIEEAEPGWFDVTGGKLTTYRLMAEETVDAIAARIGGKLRGCETAEVPLLSDGAVNQPSGILPPPLGAGVVAHFCQNEWARHLDDVLLRRSGWHYYRDDTVAVAEQVSLWMAQSLGWSEQQRHEELRRYQQLAANTYFDPSTASAQCAATSRIASPTPQDSWIIAHRGVSHDAPESTLAAFRLAWEQGADGIEADFFLTRDGHIVCTHDPKTGKLADDDLDVSLSTLADLKQLDFGIRRGEAWRGERIPTLEEIVETIPKGKKFFIELKCGPQIISPLAKILEESTLTDDQIYVISFDAQALVECKRQLPQIRTHWLSFFHENEESNGWSPGAVEVADHLRATSADGFGGQSKPAGFEARFVAELQSEGFSEFHVWWVNDARAARFYRDLGALSLTTDHPALLRKELLRTELTQPE